MTDKSDFRLISDVLQLPKPPSHNTQRRIDASLSIKDRPPAGDEITYQHSVFCQTSLPYRDPHEVREWERHQGHAHMLLKAGEAFDPYTNAWVKLGLPFGPKPRLILAYLNTEAILKQSPEIEVEDSLTAFVKSLRLNINGHTIRMLKDQLTRLSAASVFLALAGEDTVKHLRMNIVEGFELWMPKNENQRVLWPTRVTLSPNYFQSLKEYAVPLDMRAIEGLKNNALALDIYAWLAQRLWRVPTKAPHWISWAALHVQFGQGYARMDHFKEMFRKTLGLVQAHYPKAKIIEEPNKGFLLHSSPPPVPRKSKLVSVPALPSSGGQQ